ncbi:uncharacterized protein LOC121428772 [Lytechinus variegatus]|uniref:uncharacterized protein LOC121428772 n=1 Tax=Lytechinus variegatus TaxID=7654 RepID=UPI001BB1BA8E|nr:uncharacterized protein LOC121428772 [Lytechinus variegatus]
MDKLVANKKPLVLAQAASGTKGKAGTHQAAEMEAIKTKFKAKTKENLELKKRVKKLTELNMRLQNQILDVFAKQSRMLDFGPSTSTPILTPPDSAAPSADLAAPRPPSTPTATPEQTQPRRTIPSSEENRYIPIDGKVSFGENVSLTSQQWEILAHQGSVS